MAKPKVLIFGGTGFIGRNLVQFFIENDLTEKIIVVDKVPPQMAWLNEDHSKCFDNFQVEFRSSNLIHSGNCEKVCDQDVDFIFNCAAETRFGWTKEIYEESIYKLAVNCIQAARKIDGLKRYIELSCPMNSSSTEPVPEDCAFEPWSSIGKYKGQVEEYLKKNSGNMKFNIFRLPIVYGKGDRTGLTPRIIAAIIYKYLNDTMKLLWSKELKLNTIHVQDVCAAIWHICTNPESENQIINLVDNSRTTQGSITEILCDIYGIKCEYLGEILSKMTKLDISRTVKEINGGHLEPWAEVCQSHGVLNTPLTPYIDADILGDKHINLSNEKLVKGFGYQLKYPKLEKSLVQEVIDDFVQQNLLPKM